MSKTAYQEKTSSGTGWLQTYTGYRFPTTGFTPEDIDIRDIAHSLSNLCRYGGHCEPFYSVAQHCWYVSHNVPSEHALWGLLHDASEAYLCDIPRPMKQLLPQYYTLEAKIEKTIAKAFNLTPKIPMAVAEIDNKILHDERKVLLKNIGAKAGDWGPDVERIGIDIVPVLPKEAEKMFLSRFEELVKGSLL